MIRLRMLLYADDIVLFYGDVNELNNILNIYDSNFSRFGLTKRRNQPIENVISFKYLGHVLCNDPSNSSAF